MERLTYSRIKRHLIYLLSKTWEDLLKLSPTRWIRRRRVEIALRKNRTFISYRRATGCRMIVDPQTFFANEYILGSYEPGVVRYLKKVLKPGMICIDAGANVGYFTLLMARLVEPGGHVIAFEPTQYSFNLLKENIRLNYLNSVTPEQIALFDHEGILEFHEGPPGFDVYNSAGDITHPSAVNQSFTTRSVACTSLDAYLISHDIGKVDIIKIDVEGAELFVLKGMENTLLANPQVKILFECINETTRGYGYTSRDLHIWFAERGWQLVGIVSSGNVKVIAPDLDWTGQMLVAFRSV